MARGEPTWQKFFLPDALFYGLKGPWPGSTVFDLMPTPTLPPQAYTREMLAQAYAWVQTQPESVRRLATNSDTLVSLFLRYQRHGEAGLNAALGEDKVSAAHADSASAITTYSFRNELRNLAEDFEAFDTTQKGAQGDARAAQGRTNSGTGYNNQSNQSGSQGRVHPSAGYTEGNQNTGYGRVNPSVAENQWNQSSGHGRVNPSVAENQWNQSSGHGRVNPSAAENQWNQSSGHGQVNPSTGHDQLNYDVSDSQGNQSAGGRQVNSRVDNNQENQGAYLENFSTDSSRGFESDSMHARQEHTDPSGFAAFNQNDMTSGGAFAPGLNTSNGAPHGGFSGPGQPGRNDQNGRAFIGNRLGDGNGHGLGNGNGNGLGNGNGNGLGNGYRNAKDHDNGHRNGNGYAAGDGHGHGHGFGNGSGLGNGNGHGLGNGYRNAKDHDNGRSNFNENDSFAYGSSSDSGWPAPNGNGIIPNQVGHQSHTRGNAASQNQMGRQGSIHGSAPSQNQVGHQGATDSDGNLQNPVYREVANRGNILPQNPTVQDGTTRIQMQSIPPHALAAAQANMAAAASPNSISINLLNVQQQSQSIQNFQPPANLQALLDDKSLNVIEEVRTFLNLSSDVEACRVLITLGYERIRAVFKP
jgi:hypothetical protein